MESLTEGRIVHYVDDDSSHRPALIVQVHRVLPETKRAEEARREERAALSKLPASERQETVSSTTPTPKPPPSGTGPVLGAKAKNPADDVNPPHMVEGTVTSTAPGETAPTTKKALVPDPATANKARGPESQEDLVDLIVFHGLALGRPGGDGDHRFVRNAPRDDRADENIRGTWHWIE